MIYKKQILCTCLLILFLGDMYFSVIHASDNGQQNALAERDEGSRLLTTTINVDKRTKVDVWVEQELFRQPSSPTRLDNVLTIVEAGSGLARGAVFAMLGYDLGNRAHLPEEISVLFGIGAGLPMVMLGYGKIKELIGDVRVLVHGEPYYIRHLDENNANFCSGANFRRYLLKVCAFSGGVISAPPVAYLGYSKFQPYMKGGAYIVAVPTFYVRTMIDYFAVQAIASEFSPYLERPFLSCCCAKKQLVHALQQKINKSYFEIETFTNDEAMKLQAMLQGDTSPLKLRHLFHPRESLEVEGIRQERFIYNAAIAAKFLGQIIGIGGMSVYYPIARDSFAPILQAFGIEPTEENLNALGAISTATLSSLTGYATGNTFKKIFHGIARFARGQRLEARRYVSPLLGVLIAPWNAIIQTELGFEFLDMKEPLSRLKICAASIAALATCYWIVDTFFSQKVFKTFDPRLALLGKLDLISKRLSQMSFQTLQDLNRFIEGQSNEFPPQRESVA